MEEEPIKNGVDVEAQAEEQEEPSSKEESSSDLKKSGVTFAENTKEQELRSVGDSKRSSYQDTTTTTTNENVVYEWYAEDIEIAQGLSEQRKARRTFVDNNLDMISYLNEKETWYAAGARFTLFLGASLGMVGMITLLIASGETARDEGMNLWEYMKDQGSVSWLYRASSEQPTPAGMLFQAFMTASSVLIVFSNFGFYILPRWENQVSLSTMDGTVGELSHQAMKACCICRSSYRRIEATSNWVTSEEGIFKMAYNLLAGIVILLVASVPLPPADEEGSGTSSIQTTVHMVVALLAFGVMAICELYQIIRGERILKRRTGKVQIARLVCIGVGLGGMFVYLTCQDGERGSTKRGMAALWETIAFMVMFLDLMILCLIPIKAEQSVFALGGTKWRKEHARHISMKVE